MPEPLSDDQIRALFTMAAEGIQALEGQVAELQADLAAYRLLIGRLLVRDPATVEAAAEDHAAIEELTLPTTLTDGQRERTAATLGQILSAARAHLRRRSTG